MKILDVGSGHRPLPQADILVDKYLDDNSHRGGNLIKDRPLINADVESLPFENNTFDFVNASQVIEHTKNPYKAVKELKRVSKSGHIDCPSYINENILFGQKIHNYATIVVFNKIYFIRAKHPTNGHKFHKLYNENIIFKFSVDICDILFNTHIVHYYWGNGKKIYKNFSKENSKTRNKMLAHKLNSSFGIIFQNIINIMMYKIKLNEIKKTKEILNIQKNEKYDGK